jgi:hypothetical protein
MSQIGSVAGAILVTTVLWEPGGQETVHDGAARYAG